MVKVNKLYQTDWGIGGHPGSEAEKAMHEAAVAALGQENADNFWHHMIGVLVPSILGIGYVSVDNVSYAEGCKLLYMVQRDIYDAKDEPDAWDGGNGRQRALKHNGDDLRVYRDAEGKAVLYRHFVHGDCGDTWFTVSE